jgi:type VII secretion-associated serine protease mycosin
MRGASNLSAVVLAIALAVAVAAPPAEAQSSPQPYVAVVEDPDGGLTVATFTASALALGLEVAELERVSDVLAVTPDERVSTADVVGGSGSADPYRPQQWGLDRVPYERSWSETTGAGATVAVVDTGVQADHEDLTGSVLPGWDAIADAPGATTDPNGHGTHVAGIVAAGASNGRGGAGAAPGVRILPVRVLDAEGAGWLSDILQGITWSVDHGADVVNLSLGGTSGGSAYRSVLQHAHDQGVVVVAAAGNEAGEGNPVVYPAADPSAIAVGALTPGGDRASFSNYGSYLDLAAPGQDILAPCPAAGSTCLSSRQRGWTAPAGYARLSGTSMAAPFVSAAAALLVTAHPDLDPDAVKALLEHSAQDAGSLGWDPQFGAGVVDPLGALAAARGTTPADPAPDPDVPDPSTATPPPAPAPPPAPPSPPRPTAARSGYWMVGTDGRVYPFGDAEHYGDPSGALGTTEAVDVEPTPSFHGYWVVDDHGHVFAYGDASWLGNVNPAQLVAGEQVTSLSATRSGAGYWAFTTKGRVVPFGDAQFYGQASAMRLNGAVLDSIVTPSGRGYYMVASDGGIFAYGDARFYGSLGDRRLNAPVQSLVPDADGIGYWLVASDGGVFAFEAPFRGAMGNVNLNRPVTGMVRFGDGYVMVGEDGGIFNFSDRRFSGSLADRPPAARIAAVAAVEK